MSSRTWAIAILAAACLLGGSRRADAAGSCTISTTSVAFGTYNVFSPTALDSTGTVTIKCNGSASNVSIDLDKGGAGLFANRAMSGSGTSLFYNLFVDAARASIWGDGTESTSHYTNANPANNQNIVVTIYARVSGGQDVPAGSYTNSITAVVNFF